MSEGSVLEDSRNIGISKPEDVAKLVELSVEFESLEVVGDFSISVSLFAKRIIVRVIPPFCTIVINFEWAEPILENIELEDIESWEGV